MRRLNKHLLGKPSAWLHPAAALALILGSLTLTDCKTTSNTKVKNDFEAAGSQEYTVTGTDVVHLEMMYMGKSDEERMDRARILASERNRAIGFFLQAYIEDKEDTDANKDYGRFNADVRFGNDVPGDVTQVDIMTYSFKFSFDVAGSDKLIQQIQANQNITGNVFKLKTAVLDNTTLGDLRLHKEWFRSPPYDAFNPATMPQNKILEVDATIVPQPVSPDAYFPIDQMVAGGTLPIAIHFGWDGEGEDGTDDGSRHDIDLAKQLYNELVSKEGFKAPVANVDQYQPFDPNTKPLTRMMSVNGRAIEVQVTIYYGGNPATNVPGPDVNTVDGGNAVGQAMIDSFASKRVIMYLGHSGIRRGFNLANWNKTETGNIPPKTIPLIKMMDSYQLVVAEGCQTYYLSDNFWDNPAKANHKNLNLITSLGFTDADSIKTPIALIRALAKPNMTSAPLVSEVLKALNPATVKPLTKAEKKAQDKQQQANDDGDDDGEDDDPVIPVYGLHGVDENPKTDPLKH